jgi:hypothetical protein
MLATIRLFQSPPACPLPAAPACSSPAGGRDGRVGEIRYAPCHRDADKGGGCVRHMAILRRHIAGGGRGCQAERWGIHDTLTHPRVNACRPALDRRGLRSQPPLCQFRQLSLSRDFRVCKEGGQSQARDGSGAMFVERASAVARTISTEERSIIPSTRIGEPLTGPRTPLHFFSEDDESFENPAHATFTTVRLQYANTACSCPICEVAYAPQGWLRGIDHATFCDRGDGDSEVR